MNPIRPAVPSFSQVANTLLTDESYKEDLKFKVFACILCSLSIVGLPFAIIGSLLTAYEFYTDYQLTKERLQTPIEDMAVTLESKHDASAKTLEKLRQKNAPVLDSTTTAEPDASMTKSETEPDVEVVSKHPETPKLTLNQMHQILDHHSGQVIRFSDSLIARESADQTCVYLDNDEAERPLPGQIPYHVISSEKRPVCAELVDEEAARDKAELDQIMPPHTDPKITRYNKTVFHHQIPCVKDKEVFDEVTNLVRTQMSKPDNGIYLARLPSVTTPVLSLAFVDTKNAIPQVSYLMHKIEQAAETVQAKRDYAQEVRYQTTFLGKDEVSE